MFAEGAHRLIPNRRISIAGKRLVPEHDAALTRVLVDLDVDLVGECALVFHDPELSLINGTDFEAGVGVQVDLGFGSRLSKVFAGEVTALEPQFCRDLPPALRVICQEALQRLGLSQSTRALNDVDDREIVTRIAREHGLSAEAPAGSHEHVLQGNVSDAAFLRLLAHKRGNHVRIEGTRLVVGPPPRGDEITVSPADCVKKVKVRIKAGSQVGEVTVHGWDPRTRQEIVGRARPAGEMGEGARQYGGTASIAIAGHDPIPTDTATAEAMARGRMSQLTERFVTAEMEMIGDPRVVPGAVLKLEGIDDAVDGSYRVDHARHEFSKHGYVVKLKAVRIAKKKPPPPVRAAPPKQPETGWLEIELVDERRRPIPGERYRVVTSDGSVFEGRLDERGRARLTGVKRGSNTVSFPDFAPDWRRV